MFGATFLLIFFNYLQLYYHVHLMNLAEYPSEAILSDLDSSDTGGCTQYSRKNLLKEVNSRLKDISDELIMKYRFYKGTSIVLDIMFFVSFSTGGLTLLNLFFESSMAQFEYMGLLLLSSLLLIGCLVITVILLLGIFRTIMKWFVFGRRCYVIGGCILIMGIIWGIFLWTFLV